MEFLLLQFGPAILTTSAAFLLYFGLRDRGKIYWGRTLVGLGFLVAACCWLVVLTVFGDWPGAIIAIIEAFAAIGPAIGAGLWLLWSLNGRRKLIGLLVGIVFPVVLLASLSASQSYTPTALREKNGESIAQALARYRSSKGTYPQKLDELVPVYIDDLQEPETIWGWLYKANGNEFILGYVDWIDDLGYGIRVYSSSKPWWDSVDCRFPNSSVCPFVLEATPAPTPMPTRRP